jgi:uncharacterized protein (TIGR02246 family)
MNFEGSIKDRLAIRDLIDSYSDAVNRGNADDWIATWDENGIWALRGQEIIGRAAIREAWVSAMANYVLVSFRAFPGAISVSGRSAALRVHTLEYLIPHEGPSRWQHGLYDDVLVSDGSMWRFAQRSFSVLSTHA